MSVIYVVDDWGFVEILDQKKIRRAGCIAGPKKRPCPPTPLKGAGC